MYDAVWYLVSLMFIMCSERALLYINMCSVSVFLYILQCVMYHVVIIYLRE